MGIATISISRPGRGRRRTPPRPATCLRLPGAIELGDLACQPLVLAPEDVGLHWEAVKVGVGEFGLDLAQPGLAGGHALLEVGQPPGGGGPQLALGGSLGPRPGPVGRRWAWRQVDRRPTASRRGCRPGLDGGDAAAVVAPISAGLHLHFCDDPSCRVLWWFQPPAVRGQTVDQLAVVADEDDGAGEIQ